jgi:hypothetical protein
MSICLVFGQLFKGGPFTFERSLIYQAKGRLLSGDVSVVEDLLEGFVEIGMVEPNFPLGLPRFARGLLIFAAAPDFWTAG